MLSVLVVACASVPMLTVAEAEDLTGAEVRVTFRQPIGEAAQEQISGGQVLVEALDGGLLV